MTDHRRQQIEFRRKKRERKKALGLIPPTRKEKLDEAIKVLVCRGVPRKELEDFASAVRYIWTNDSGVTYHDYEAMLDRYYFKTAPPPICEECNEEMHRYTDPNSGKDGYSCDLCGWSQDDD